MTRRIKRYGWLPDLPDHRDFPWDKMVSPAQLPDLVDLTTFARPSDGMVCMPSPYDQSQLGSCTGNGIAGASEYAINRQNLPPLGPSHTPSRLMIYWGERQEEGTIDQDSGAMIRDGISFIAKNGLADESEWPYDIARFTERPPDPVWSDAAKHLVQEYAAVSQTADDIKGTLANGYMVVFGFTVYQTFESSEVARTGVVPMPRRNEKVLGGHCVCLVGYDEASRRYKCRNSWGAGWGEAGYFYLPYQYVEDPDLADDFWVIELVMPPDAPDS